MIRAEHRQLAYPVRLEWGAAGVDLLAADCAVVVVVDVLSFGTAVDVAVGRGAVVLPRRVDDPDACTGVVAAGPRHGSGPSLRPSSLLGLPAGTRIALPSPNGATLCAAAAARDVVLFAGCLRNATAVAAAARAVGGPIGLVPAGERWPDGTLRPAIEDLLGAGAIAAALPGGSPEAAAAADAFTAALQRGLRDVLGSCASGRELVADGFGPDVDLAAAVDASSVAPRLVDGALR